MTLVEVIRAIEYVASNQPSVKMIVENDIFRINGKPDCRYGIFAWTQGQHTANTSSSFINYTFSFIYADRLKADLSNQVEIQSVGIETLNNIIRSLEEYDVYAEQDYTFQTFNQRFADLCAGVFCNITLSVPIDGTCPDFFADFNDDFNEDFLIF